MTSILIVHHDTYDDLMRLLDALHGESADGLQPQERIPVRPITIVDNASTDRRLSDIQRVYPRVDILCLEKNVGYAAAVNAGIQRLENGRVLLLNADVIVTPEKVEALERVASRLGFPTAVGPLHRYEDGTPQVTWGLFPTRRTEKRRQRLTKGCRDRDPQCIKEVTAEAMRTRDVNWISGSCMLIDRNSTGGEIPWDEQFFLYFEDIDWCQRVRLAGGRIVHTSEVVVIHRHGTSMENQPIVSEAAYRKSQMRYTAKYHGKTALWALRLYMTWKMLLSCLIGKLVFGINRRSAWAQLRAVWSPVERDWEPSPVGAKP